MPLKTNALYYGDNLKILREHIPSNSIDLIYLDPPFNSKRNYNVIFKEETSKESEAQIGAFEDTWGWGNGETEKTYHEIIATLPINIAQTIESFIKFLGHNDVTAYLVMMTPRLVELHRVLKSNGSIYIHCDPTASHYLKIIMDQIFDKTNFQNEIIWWYRKWSKSDRRFLRNHDVIFFYTKGENNTFNIQYVPLSASTIKRFGIMKETTIKTETGRKQALLEEESPGSFMPDVWEIPLIIGANPERLGYQTQKPLALLKRIIKASSNEGDVVLDPFCGCGTTLVAAQSLGRKWVGIDITHLAVGLMRRRLKDLFRGIKIETIGEPEDLSGARELAMNNKYQFEWWALDLSGARPAQDKRKGADKGIDGLVPFIEKGEILQRAIVQVKGGSINVAQIRDLKGVVEREKAAIGVLITLEQPTKPMREEAAISGYYHSDTWDKDYPKIQILTIEELLAGKKIDMPPHKEPYKSASMVHESTENQELFDL